MEVVKINKGDKFGSFREEDYANRLCCGVDEERSGLVMFEPDLVPGTEVQLMRRSVDFQYIEQHTNELLQRAAGRRPFFALYIDCAGRASAYCGSDSEEAAEVQRILGAQIPLLGVYCGVEIARVGRVLQPHGGPCDRDTDTRKPRRPVAGKAAEPGGINAWPA